LSRSFESNGPDVKIRGTPAHIAEKYVSLARDAMASGDPVLAENYLQHAEHYNRIIMAYREQQMQQGGGDIINGMGQRARFFGTSDLMDGSEDYADEEQGDDMGAEPQPPMNRGAEGQSRSYEPREGRDERYQRPHHDHQGRRDRGERHRYPPQAQDRQPEPPTEAPPSEQPRADQPPRRRERFGQAQEQPEFLRRPIRRVRRESNGNGGATPDDEGSGDGETTPPDKTTG
jgi:hypothetical protein